MLTDMMEQVVDKAEEYLESATKENSWDELHDDEDGGNELDAEVEVRLWVEQLSIMSKVNEMALELSAANKVNANEVNVMNKVNEENEVNVNVKDDNKVKVFDARVNNGKVGLRLYDKKAEAKQSCPANWDPGELPDAKDQMELLDVEEVTILVNDDKVGLRLSKKEVRLRCDVTMKALLNAMTLCNFVRLYISEMLVLDALNAARFVDVKPVSSRCFAESFPPILSDYG